MRFLSAFNLRVVWLAQVMGAFAGLPALAQVFTTPAPVYTDALQLQGANYLMAKAGGSSTTFVAWVRYGVPTATQPAVSDVMFSVSTAGGAFSPAEIVGAKAGEFDMFSTSAGDVHLVAARTPTGYYGETFLEYRNRPAGGTFLAPIQLTQPGVVNWPRVVANDQGTVWVVWAGACGASSSGIGVRRSSDNGQSFSPSVCVADGTSAPTDIAIDSTGRLHVFYAAYAGQVGDPAQPAFNLNYRRSDPSQPDGFLPTVTVAANVSQTRNWDLEVAPNGSVGIAYSLGSSTATLFYSKSSDGISFTTTTVSSGEAQTPDLIFDAQSGAHLAWEPLNMGGNVFYAYAADGLNFAAPVQLSAVSTLSQQAYWPRIALDNRGFVNVSWNLYDEAASGGLAFLSRSGDHVSFTAQLVSVAPSTDVWSGAEIAIDGEGRLTVVWPEMHTKSGYSPIDMDVWFAQAASSVPGNAPPGTPIPPQAGPPADPGKPTNPGPPTGVGRPPR